MAISRARKALLLGLFGAVAAGFGATALSTAQAAPLPTATTEAATDMPVAVEDFNYPGAERLLQERGITLKRGDGHITLVPCSQPWDIKVESRLDKEHFCFDVNAKQGYLTLELPDAYGIWTGAHSVEATLTAEGAETVVDVPANDYKPVGEGDLPSGAKPSVLVELRVSS
ncbi:hypothetical protein AB0A69_27915 [Streptomyces sp. NPDC045431]|uniref:hypothetical protein n=1 Tax=Streptomyces sp. NPDC045431 TaxID=3155613 RepID=UPI0033E942E4